MAKKDTPKKEEAYQKRRKRIYRRLLILFWLGVVSPFVAMTIALSMAASGSFGPLPSFEELENPKSNLATEVFSADHKLLGKYFKENRTNASYDELSPYLVKALVATEDERYYDHSGVDFRGLSRAVVYLGKRGGASTISQQLAKMLFHDANNLPFGERVKQKFKEWIIASQLERRYTKEEVIAMYFNRFDFLNNAVGIKSASAVYFNTSPADLKIEEAALLVGLCKNPSLYNPLRFNERATDRRNTVLGQMLRNDYLTKAQHDSLVELPIELDYRKVDHNEGLAPYFREILREEVQDLLVEREDVDTFYFRYKGETEVDKDQVVIESKSYSASDLGANPGSCEDDTAHVWLDGKMYIVNNAYNESAEKCLCTVQRYKHRKADGTAYDIYTDGLRVFTPIDSRMQAYAEEAVITHMSTDLQPTFDKKLANKRNRPFSYKVSQEQIDQIMNSARKRSERYRKLKKSGMSQEEILENFDTPIPMRVFSWKGGKENRWEIDTVMSPNDSIKHYKSFFQTGMMSMDPKTGFVKAWVGGINHHHFKYDHVWKSRRQVGSTFKPFVYASYIVDNHSPCEEMPNTPIRFDKDRWGMDKDWQPKNSDGKYGGLVSLKFGLANSLNTISARIMHSFGPIAGPMRVVNMARSMGVKSPLTPVPSLALGVADLSVWEMVGANATFANKGVYIKPIIITRIEDKHGNVIYDVIPETNEVMTEEQAYVMIDLMKGVVDGVYNKETGKRTSTGGRVRFRSRPYGGIKSPVAGKTGTTQNNSDGWFIGITPDLVTGVWTGAEDRSVHFDQTAFGQGANMALPIWGYYMKSVFADKRLKISQGDFEKPLGTLSIELDCSAYGEQNAPFEELDYSFDEEEDY